MADDGRSMRATVTIGEDVQIGPHPERGWEQPVV